jgi:hypothetical protein
MAGSAKVQRERKRAGLCVGCGKKPKAGFLRCETCLARQRAYDTAWRAKQKGATVEPQCNVAGKLRAEHVYDEDGLCDCGARQMVFAERPPLRPEMVKTRPAKPKAVAAPVVVRTPQPLAVQRVASKPGPKPGAKKRRAVVIATEPEKRIGGVTFGALIADLERQREQLDDLIASLRKVEAWWPRS